MLTALILFVLVGNGHTTWMRNEAFRTQFALWTDNSEKAPGLSIVHDNYGRQYAEKGLHKDAYKEFKKAILLNRYMDSDQAAATHCHLGLHYWNEKRNFPLAMSHFRKAVELDPESSQGWQSIAYLELSQRNGPAAYDAIMKGVGPSPSNPDLLTNLAIVLFANNKVDEAIREANRALVLDPNASKPLIVLAECCRRKGDYEQALLYWEQYAARRPENMRAQLSLVELYARLGRKVLLRQTLHRILYMKKEKSISDLVRESAQQADALVYTPGLKEVSSIIRAELVREALDIRVR